MRKNVKIELSDGTTHSAESGDLRLDSGGVIMIASGSRVTMYAPGQWVEASYDKGSGAAWW